MPNQEPAVIVHSMTVSNYFSIMVECYKQYLLFHINNINKIMKFNKENVSDFLHTLQRVKGNQIGRIVKKAKPQLIRALLHIAHQYHSGKTQLPPHHNKQVGKGRQKIGQFANTCLSHTLHKKGAIHCKPEGVRRARQLLVNQKGGFFAALLPLIAAIAPLVIKAFTGGDE